MRLFIIVFIIVIIVLIIAWGIKVWDNIVFGKPSFRGSDLSQFNVDPLNGSFEGNLVLNLPIENKNSFPIPFYNMKGTLYYNNEIIAETSPILAKRSFKALANSNKIYDEDTSQTMNGISDKIYIHGNASSIKLIKQIISKQKPKIDYTIKITVFGIPLTYSDFFEGTI